MARVILIVDDEIDLADTCARVLEASGFNCLVAYDAPMALLLFDSQQTAMVLSDINLPNGSGYEIAAYVRHKSPVTPVILMTTYHSANAQQDAIRAGAAGYLRKPFSNSELIATVRSLLCDDRD